jgi:hypothetical protein
MNLTRGRNGIILRFPFSPKQKKSTGFHVSFTDFCAQKIKEGHLLGYKCFIFELIEEDFHILDFSDCPSMESLRNMVKDMGVRLAFYIKSKKSVTSDFPEDVVIAVDEIKKCLEFSICLTDTPQESPVILHVGGAKGDRRSTMERFCNVLTTNFTPEEIKRISVINDDKPSLFSVKDLLPGVFYKLRCPIIFRSTSYPTNQGNLTLNESLFLAASTWDRTINPIFIYLPGEEAPDVSGETAPFGLQLDIIFDNKLPEPK